MIQYRNMLSYLRPLIVLLVASNGFASDLNYRQDPRAFKAELNEYDRQGNDLGRGSSKSITRYPTTPYTFVLELESDCDEINCQKASAIHLFLVKGSGWSSCGSTHYTAVEITAVAGGPRLLEVLDHSTRDCDDFIEDGWQATLTEASGNKEDQRFFGGSPKPILPSLKSDPI